MKIRCVYMRGGTSKGVLFHRRDLPHDQALWDRLFLAVMGGPDPKQIDGLGGTVSSNNKIVVVSRSSRPGIDVEYLVAQVVVGTRMVDYSANCGNMASAVGPFAIEEGLVHPRGPVTTLRMLNLNTSKVIEESIPTRNGVVEEAGDCAIAGVDGTGAELKVGFLDPAGADTGRLLPTGRATTEIRVEGFGVLPVSVVDLSTVFVFLHGSDLGVHGNESPQSLNADSVLMERVERVRGTVARTIGLVTGSGDAATCAPGRPKVVILAPPTDYRDLSGRVVTKEEMDVCVRVVSVGAVHKAVPLTAAIATGGAAFITDSIVQTYVDPARLMDGVRIGHPSGVMAAYVDHHTVGGETRFRVIATQRTARRLMDGYVYVPDSRSSKSGLAGA